MPAARGWGGGGKSPLYPRSPCPSVSGEAGRWFPGPGGGGRRAGAAAAGPPSCRPGLCLGAVLARGEAAGAAGPGSDTAGGRGFGFPG